MKSVKVAVTGSTGMLGLHVSFFLKSLGYTVVNVSRETWNIEDPPDSWNFSSFLEDVDFVIHCAAIISSNFTSSNCPSSAKLISVNTASSVYLAQWCQKNNIHLIYISGAVCYKDPNKVGIAEDDEKSLNCLGGAYGLSKYLAEQAVLSVTGERCTVFRPSSLYGTGMPSNRLVQKFILQAKKNLPIELSAGKNLVNLLHCSDVARAIELAISRKAYGIFNLASGESESYKEIASKILSLTSSSSVLIDSGDNQNAQNRMLLDFSRAQSQLGYEPHITVHDGILLMLNNRYF
ncbi:MAG: NAD(P)-dependent oxidoreductase [Cellvibrionaceae bacterium]|nr:NAD(P)-dependent oxidoreductase [Cellvibrionaceae bacterium]